MAKFDDRIVNRVGENVSIDQGLRAFLLGVYNYMALGLALTGAVAYFVSTQPALMNAIYTTPLRWVVMFAPLGIVLYFSFRLHAMAASTAQTIFWIYSATMGLSLSWIFMAFTGISITKVFFITSGTFAAMSLYGYTTQRDLSGFGSFFMMGLIGLIIGGLVNMFLRSPGFDFVLSSVGVLLFVGLTAYDTQIIKSEYAHGDDSEVAAKKSIMGALRLYLDFLNLFLYMLRFMGDRR